MRKRLGIIGAYIKSKSKYLLYAIIAVMLAAAVIAPIVARSLSSAERETLETLLAGTIGKVQLELRSERYSISEIYRVRLKAYQNIAEFFEPEGDIKRYLLSFELYRPESDIVVLTPGVYADILETDGEKKLLNKGFHHNKGLLFEFYENVAALLNEKRFNNASSSTPPITVEENGIFDDYCNIIAAGKIYYRVDFSPFIYESYIAVSPDSEMIVMPIIVTRDDLP